MNFKIYIILDNCPIIYKIFFQKYKNKYDIEVIECRSKKGNSKTFMLQLDLLKNANTDYVFFVEDDYYFSNNFINKVTSFMNKFKVDFVTPLYHKDYEKLEWHKYEKNKVLYDCNTWINVASSTLTFFARKKSLIKNYKIFKTFKYKNYDSAIWFAITKKNFLIKFFDILKDIKLIKILIKFYLFNFFKNKDFFTLYVCKNSFAIHVDRNDFLIKNNPQLKFFFYNELYKY
jgi:hypothetical protein